MINERAEIAIIVNNVSDCPGLISEHGFSMYIKSGDLRIIFDAGQEGSVFENNVSKLGIDMQSVNSVVLSHGHYDHTGGIPSVLSACGAVDLYAHPGIWETRYSVRADRVKSNGITLNSYKAIKDLPEHCLHLSEESVKLSGKVGLTGYIPRITEYEDTGGPFYFDKDGKQPDPISDDQALWIQTAKGVVVCAGCSHSGIVNTLRYVRKISGCEKIHAVIGGLHLVNASEERIEKTIAALDEFGLDLIVPCHCTGAAATERLCDHFKERAQVGAAGARFGFEDFILDATPLSRNTSGGGAASTVNTSGGGTSCIVDATPSSRTEKEFLNYFDPGEPIGNIQGGNLPHWRQDGVVYFVTWRTSDSMPATRVKQWMEEREEWVKKHPEPCSIDDRAEYDRLFPARWERWLDECHGECLLARPDIGVCVSDSLKRMNGEHYTLYEWVIMPNHVHVLLSPKRDMRLSDIVQAWKSVSAHAINKILLRRGAFWQKESFDHIVRNADEMERIRDYIHAQAGNATYSSC